MSPNKTPAESLASERLQFISQDLVDLFRVSLAAARLHDLTNQAIEGFFFAT